MNENSSHQQVAKDLLKQDEGLSEARMQQERTRLVSAVELAERKEKIIRRATLISCILLGFMVLLMSAVLVLFPVARVLGGVITLILLLGAGTLLTLYNDKYRPAVKARRDDLQSAILADLQRQVEDLKKTQSKETK